MILDTEFLVSLKAGQQPAREKAAELEAADVPVRIPTAVLLELYRAVGAGDDSFRNARDFEALVANKPVVGLDENVARRAGVLDGVHLASDSRPDLGAVDAIVAATGLVYSEAVVTEDDDFEDVDGLQVDLYV